MGDYKEKLQERIHGHLDCIRGQLDKAFEGGDDQDTGCKCESCLSLDSMALVMTGTLSYLRQQAKVNETDLLVHLFDHMFHVFASVRDKDVGVLTKALGHLEACKEVVSGVIRREEIKESVIGVLSPLAEALGLGKNVGVVRLKIDDAGEVCEFDADAGEHKPN